MTFLDCLFSAAASLRSNKLRPALTTLGIIIGVVFALILIITYYKYLKRKRVQFDFETLF